MIFPVKFLTEDHSKKYDIGPLFEGVEGWGEIIMNDFELFWVCSSELGISSAAKFFANSFALLYIIMRTVKTI